MKLVEAIIREVVESYALVTLDDDGNLIEVEDVIDEEGRYDLELVSIEKEIKQDKPIKDPREVE